MIRSFLFLSKINDQHGLSNNLLLTARYLAAIYLAAIYRVAHYLLLTRAAVLVP